jgi:hypothetical protein
LSVAFSPNERDIFVTPTVRSPGLLAPRFLIRPQGTYDKSARGLIVRAGSSPTRQLFHISVVLNHNFLFFNSTFHLDAFTREVSAMDKHDSLYEPLCDESISEDAQIFESISRDRRINVRRSRLLSGLLCIVDVVLLLWGIHMTRVKQRDPTAALYCTFSIFRTKTLH